jgi:hypothetical protein
MNFQQWCEKFDLFPCRITREWWNAALAAEREAILKLHTNNDFVLADEFAAAIRARRTP